jgi:hypothetical protein
MQRRLIAIADKYSLDMLNVMFQLILELRAIVGMGEQKAIDTHPAKDDVKQNWIRLAAYIGQVINAIGKIRFCSCSVSDSVPCRVTVTSVRS